MSSHDDEVCSICGRLLGDVMVDEHHLIPKTFKGKETITLHKVCHRMIHATFSERELQKYYHTIERLLSDEKMQRFVEWVKKKPLDFYISIDDTVERKSKRRGK
jgi:hypothetical protein